MAKWRVLIGICESSVTPYAVDGTPGVLAILPDEPYGPTGAASLLNK
jgi:hypothetical protein